MSRLSRLRAAALPFVTRSLRGNRLRRYCFLSLVLGAMTVLLGAWFTLSSGSFERELREAFSLEAPRYEQQREQFTIFADTDEDYDELRFIKDSLADPERRAVYSYEFYRVADSVNEARATLRGAVLTPAPRNDLELASQAAAVLQRHDALFPDGINGNKWDDNGFSWYDRADHERLEIIVAQGLQPRIVRYESPFGLMDMFRFTGVLAGLGLAALAFVFGPLLAATQMAQETHENTLMPLTGTAMRARDLVIGLFAGPMTVIAIVAAPQVALLLGTSLLAGSILPTIGLVLVLASTCFMLSMLTQLVGFALGRQRTPGLIGIALLMLLSALAFFGVGLGFTVNETSSSVLAILPQASAFHLLRAGLVPPDPLWTYDAAMMADTAMVFGTVGVALLGLLGARALERRISGLPGASLTRLQAFLGAAISIVLVTLANPAVQRGHNIVESFYISLGLLTVPLLALLMTRVPVGDIPAKLRKIPVWSIIGELFAYVALLFVLTVAATNDMNDLDELLHPMALIYLSYTLLLAGLLTIRATAVKAGIAGRVWIAFCGMFMCMTFVHAAEWADRGSRMDLEDVFGLFHVSPLLGVAQIGLTVALPILLMRAIRPAGGKLADTNAAAA